MLSVLLGYPSVHLIIRFILQRRGIKRREIELSEAENSSQMALVVKPTVETNENKSDVQTETAKMDGHLLVAKKTLFGRRWRKRYLILTDKSLYCFEREAPDGNLRTSEFEVLRLSDVAMIRNKRKRPFLQSNKFGQVSLGLNDGQIIKLRTSSLDEFDEWSGKLAIAIDLMWFHTESKQTNSYGSNQDRTTRIAAAVEVAEVNEGPEEDATLPAVGCNHANAQASRRTEVSDSNESNGWEDGNTSETIEEAATENAPPKTVEECSGTADRTIDDSGADNYYEAQSVWNCVSRTPTTNRTGRTAGATKAEELLQSTGKGFRTRQGKICPVAENSFVCYYLTKNKQENVENGDLQMPDSSKSTSDDHF